MSEDLNPMMVTTDNDYFNSADEAHFSVLKGQVKQLPDELTPILANAIDQGLLREATSEEIKAQKEADVYEEKVKVGKAKPIYGRTLEETLKLREERAKDGDPN